jgi:hypothetical protein
MEMTCGVCSKLQKQGKSSRSRLFLDMARTPLFRGGGICLARPAKSTPNIDRLSRERRQEGMRRSADHRGSTGALAIRIWRSGSPVLDPATPVRRLHINELSQRLGHRTIAVWQHLWQLRSTQTPATVHGNSENIGPIMGTLLRPIADFEGTLAVRCGLRRER